MPCTILSTPGLQGGFREETIGQTQEIIGQTLAPERHKALDHKMTNGFSLLLPTQGSSKLEKAEILQMTVDHLKMLHATGGAGKNCSYEHKGEVKVQTWKENSPAAAAAASCLPPALPFYQGKYLLREGRWTFSSRWVSIHLGMWDGESPAPQGQHWWCHSPC